MTDTQGASNNERLLAAAREGELELLQEVFEHGGFNINFQDGVGNTALHYAARAGHLDVLEEILSCEGCDVDPVNRLEKATPLHLAIRIEEPDVRNEVVESLLDAGADITIKDKQGDRAIDIVPVSDTALRALFRKAQATASISKDDIADDDDDDEPGSGSGSE